MTGPDLICIGAIAGSFGVSGEVRLKSFCSEPTDIATYGPLFTEDGSRQFHITLTRPVSGGLGARIEGVRTKEQADALRGTSLHVPRDRLPSLPDDEFYHADLIGLAAHDPGGALIGKVIAIYNHGAGDILEISTNRHKSALLLPFTTAIVPNVDLAAGRIVVNLPEDSDE
ncbi:ribosome maturation factor RimM [Tabrizicola sp.]|uniref:ribosome maturation factor RimM n=1 Tax=Tabrizicola sp. TaxID=2005166 RepID=UPI002FDD7D46